MANESIPSMGKYGEFGIFSLFKNRTVWNALVVSDNVRPGNLIITLVPNFMEFDLLVNRSNSKLIRFKIDQI